jgi:poly-gamma-glutamate synthesis protein (capsule biosynthesis protein)
MPFHPDARMTGIAVCAMQGKAIGAVGLLPCLINSDNQPVPASADSETGQRILEYMRQISGQAELATRYGEDDPAVAGMRAISVN